jgi:hypothetical protein
MISLPSFHQLHIHTYTALSLWTAESMPRVCEYKLQNARDFRFSKTKLTIIISLSHLVGFALKLRNLGISDHGLIRELSQPLAGSLYTGEGHSRLYDDEAVYQYVQILLCISSSN